MGGGGRGGDARAQGHLMGCINSDARIHDQELEEEHEMEGKWLAEGIVTSLSKPGHVNSF